MTVWELTLVRNHDRTESVIGDIVEEDPINTTDPLLSLSTASERADRMEPLAEDIGIDLVIGQELVSGVPFTDGSAGPLTSLFDLLSEYVLEVAHRLTVPLSVTGASSTDKRGTAVGCDATFLADCDRTRQLIESCFET
jgi:hypothetical protein